MARLIDKDALMAEIERLEKVNLEYKKTWKWKFKWFYCTIIGRLEILEGLKSYIDTLKVKDPYEQCIQYPSVKDGIEAHAETYSFNIESELFNQLTKEQQALWRKEIEQAVVSGGEAGAELTRDPRYKENLKVKEVDFEEGLKTQNKNIWHPMSETAEHPCAVLMHGYGNDVWIADAVETLEQGAAQEWAYMDDVLTVLGLKAKGE